MRLAVPFASVVQLLAGRGVEPQSGIARAPVNPRYLQAGIALHWY